VLTLDSRMLRDGLLGVHATTFSRPTIESHMEAVAAYGFTVTQYDLASAGLASPPERVEPALARRVAAAAAVRGVRIAAVSGGVNMIHPDVEQRRSGLRRLRALALVCGMLGTRIITLGTGSHDVSDMLRGHLRNGARDAWWDLYVSMDVALGIAEELDLELAIVPDARNVIGSSTAALRLLRDVGSRHLKIALDPARLFSSGDIGRQDWILEEAFDLLGEHIVLATARTGVLDYELYLRLLQPLRVPLIVDGVTEADVPRFSRMIRSMAARAEQCPEQEEAWLLSA
jgi:sugar phosphate isomerase/epimerase